MSSEPELTRTVRSWLQEDAHESANRVLDSVLQIVDTTPQRRPPWSVRRFPTMNGYFRTAAVAAAIAIAAIVGLTFVSRTNVGDHQQTPMPTPSPAPSTVSAGDLTPGAYRVADPFPVRLTFRVPAGWRQDDTPLAYRSVITKEDGEQLVGLGFWLVENLPKDPCRMDLGEMDPPVGPTVNDLASAFGRVKGVKATTPSTITMDGYSGQQLEITVPPEQASCVGTASTWVYHYNQNSEMANQHDLLRILDVKGTRLVIEAFNSPNSSAAFRRELQQVLDSIEIE